VEGYSIQHEETPIWESRSVKNLIRKKYPSKQAASILLIYGGLCELAGDNSRGLWPVHQIAKRSCVSDPTASDGLHDLEGMGVIRIVPQRDARGHVSPSLIILLSRAPESLTETSLVREVQTRESGEQKNSSKDTSVNTPKESIQETPKLPAFTGGGAIRAFCDQRLLHPQFKGEKYVVTGRDTGEIGKLFKGPTPPTEKMWLENLKVFWTKDAQYTGNHNLSVFCRNFNLYNPTGTETKGHDEVLL
jgi:hypothetical protein